MPELTTSNPQAALVDLSLSAVALCNQGANSRAHILLNKRKEQASMPNTFEELMAELNPEAAALVAKHIEQQQKDSEAKISALSGEIATLKAAGATGSKPAAAEADILKGASPEVRSLFEKMQGQLNELVNAQQEAAIDKRYELCKAIPCEESELRAVLKSASPATLAILEKASKAIQEGLCKAAGSDVSGSIHGSSADDAYAALERAAKSISAEQGITFEKAFTQACMNDPDTYRKYVEGVR